MALPPPTFIEFSVGHDDDVVGAMDDLGARHGGWINLDPESDPDDDPPARRGLATLLLAGPAHDVPTCTWVAGKVGRNGVQPDQIGIQHGAGARVLWRLRDELGGLPEGWRLVQDHPRRGLVAEPASGDTHSTVLGWLLEAGTLLSAVRLTGAWQATVHHPV